MNGVLGNYATLGLNIADFARYSNKVSAQNVQAIVIPFIFSEWAPLCRWFIKRATDHPNQQLSLDCSVSLPPQQLKQHMAMLSGILL
jgi:cytosine/uracil/thiamine/allantoin permease